MNIIETDHGITYVPFINTELISPFAPEWRFFIAEKILSRIDCNRLKNYLLSKQPEILAIKDKLTDAGTGLGNDSTTARFRSYNVMTWDQPDINILKEEISIMHDNYYRDIVDRPTPEVSLGGWMNIMRKGDRIKKHVHGYGAKTYLSGHFTVSCEDTKTVYVNPYEHWDEEFIMRDMIKYDYHHSEKVYAPDNVVGKITLFPNYVPHFTTEHTGDDLRITVAFDIMPLLNK